MVGGLLWDAVSSAFGWQVLFIGGAIQAIGTLFFENRLLRDAAKPRLRIAFETGQLFDSLHHEDKLRIFRVGVANSGDSVGDVSVKVARILPELPRVFPMQELQQTHHQDGVSRFTVNKSSEPLVFVDVIHQTIYTKDTQISGSRNGHSYTKHFKKGTTNQMFFSFANGLREIPLEADHYLIWLAIDGAGAEGTQKFVLQRNAQGQYDMSKAFS